MLMQRQLPHCLNGERGAMKRTRYDDGTLGKVISMHCRRSSTNPDVVVLDTTRLEQVYVYEQATIDDVIACLQDILHLDIRVTDQLPVTTRLVRHQPVGYIYRIPHEEDEARDDFHAFFAPLDADAG